jgi:membrane protease YdiL (CAAX protease family)
VALWFAHRLDWRAFSSVRDVVERQVVPWFARSTKAEFAVLALAAGFGEEFLFRGLLQDGLIRWCGEGAWAITIGMVLAALVFGACHALNRAYFALATFMGLYLGVLYWWTGDLLAPILTHALYDFVALVWLVRRPTAAEK